MTGFLWLCSALDLRSLNMTCKMSLIPSPYPQLDLLGLIPKPKAPLMEGLEEARKASDGVGLLDFVRRPHAYSTGDHRLTLRFIREVVIILTAFLSESVLQAIMASLVLSTNVSYAIDAVASW
jgi:hypothetical protein